MSNPLDIIITLPENVTLVINSNQDVDFETVLYKISKLDEIKISLTNKLNIKPSEIFKYLKKFVGDEIVEGEAIAIKKSVFSDLKYQAEYSGVIKEVNHETGDIIVQTNNNKFQQKKSFFKGIVKEINDNMLTVIISSNPKSFPIKKTADDFGGEIYYLKDIKNTSLTENEVNNKIIFSEFIPSYFQSKLEALDVAGFVTLKSMYQSSNLPSAQIKNIDDLSQIIGYNSKYCLIVKKDNLIYFYN